MGKRGADEYITKDQGSTPNVGTETGEGSPVKMATPAQLAARKLKTPKSRLGARGNASTGAGFGSITASNPFGQPQQQATFAPVGGNGGFSFGQQSQSFPADPTPQIGGFNFTAPQASSFTFGQDASQPATSSAPSFGFGSNSTTNTTQPSPATFSFAQPAQTNGQSTTSANSFSFGQNTAQPNGQSTQVANPFSFGQPPSQPNGQRTPATNQFNFGQSTSQLIAAPTSNAPPSTSLFGQNSNTTSNMQPSQPVFSFGQNAQPNGQSNTASNLFGFGSKTTQAEAPSVSDTPKAAFSFGSNNNSNNQESPQPSFSFGKPAETNGQTTTPQASNKFIFGESAPQPSTSSIFGQSTSGSASSNLFGGQKSSFSFGSSTAPEQPSMDDTMMVSPAKTAQAPAEPRAPSPTGEAAPMSSSATDSAPSTEPSSATNTLFGRTQTPNFSFGAPSPAAAPTTNQNSLFGRSPETPKFSFGAPANPNDLKSPTEHKSTAPEPRAPSPVAAAAPPTKSLFQNMTPAPEQAKSSVPPESTPAPKSLFQALAPTSAPTTESLFGPPVQLESTPALKTLFQPPASTLAPISKSLFGPQAQTDNRPVSFAAPQSSQQPARAVNNAPIEFEKVKLRSNAPSEPLNTNDHSKAIEHDKMYRLRSLNMELPGALARYDPGSQEFDNILIHYYQTREKLSLMWPPGARNSKRKADDEDRPEERSSPTKKTKMTESFSSNNTTLNVFSHEGNSKRKADDEDRQEERFSPAKKTKTTGSSVSNNTTSNVFNQTPSSNFAAPKINSSGTAPAPLNVIKGPSSNTSNLFQSMLSAKSAPAQSDKPKSPFANISSASAQSALTPPSSTPLPAVAKPASPVKQVSPPSEEAEDDDMDEEESEEDEDEDDHAEDDEEEEEEDFEGQGEDGDNDASDDDEQDEEAPMAKPENQGKSLFDRIQPAASADGEKLATTPNGIQDKNALKQPAPNHSFKPFTPFAPGVAKSTPQAPTVSPLTPFGGSVKPKAAAIFEFKPSPPTTTPTPVPGASIFAGGSIMSNGPIPGEGLFGSRPSTPNNGDAAPTNIFAGFAKMPNTTIDPAKDNTWAKGSPLKFGTPQKSISEAPKFGGGSTTNFMKAFGSHAEENEKKEKAKRKYEDLGSDAEEDEIEEWEKEYEEKQRAKRAKVSNFGQGGFKPSVAQSNEHAKEQTGTAPTFSITAATPPPKSTANSEKFANLFGQKSPAASPAPPGTNTVGFSFGAAPSTEFAFGSASALQPAASYLFPSGNTSGLSSRATSPGGTDNESVDTNGEADATNDPQTSLMSDRPGEENEEVLYETRAKALKFLDKEAAAKQKGSTPDAYNSVGLGFLRVLKNSETGRARVVIRAEPGSNVLLNTLLVPFVSYTNDPRAKGSGAVRLGVPTENDGIEQWVLKVKNAEKAVELAAILTKNKPSA